MIDVYRTLSTRKSCTLRGPVAMLFAPGAFLLIWLALVGFGNVAGRYLQAPGDVSEVRANQSTIADQQEPALAVDPTNPNNVLSAAKDWRTGPKQVWYYRSSDGGRTWADGHMDISSELPNQSDPVLGFDTSGTAYLVVLGYNQNDLTVGGVFVSRSQDKGVTWSKPVLVSSNSDKLFNDKEWLTVDRSNNPSTRGNVYLTWTLFTTLSPTRDRGDIVTSRSTDGGKSFSSLTMVSLQEQGNTQGSFPAVGPNGELYVLYYSGVGASDLDDRAAGDASSQAQTGREAPAPTSDALYLAKSTDDGQTFPQVTRVATVSRPPAQLPGSDFRLFVLPALAVDPRSGALYVTWNDYSTGDADVKLTASTDGGRSWNSPVRVNDDPSSPRHDQFFPTLTVGSDGTLHLLWLDRRDDPNNKKYAPYYTRSTDGGKTFARDVRLSGTLSDPAVGFQGTIIGDYISLDTSADGSRVYAAWPDTRGGDQDIYFSSFDSKAGPAVLTAPPTSGKPTPVAVASPQPLTGFEDEAFLRTWERADRPVLVGKASRAWLWGPVSFATANEPYSQGVNGTRAVQYFDKARMEINNPAGNRASPSFVTNGLLVVELISGRIQTGDAQFEAARPPSQAPVAGDNNSPDALTYSTLAAVASLNNDKRAPDRTGQGVTAVLNRSGQVLDDPTRAGTIKLAKYEPTIGHNIPDLFWNFMNSSGAIYNGPSMSYSDGKIVNWQTDLGFPITEPYWTNVKIAGVSKWVMLQAFQRRVLTYVADNPAGVQVEMGNVGRHYFDWRYGQIGQPGR